MLNNKPRVMKPAINRDWMFLGATLVIFVLIFVNLASIDSEISGNQLNRSVVFGNYKGYYQSDMFSQGRLRALFGNNIIDLSEATIEAPEAVLQATAIMGQVKIRVPKHWRVRVAGNPFAGLYIDDTSYLPSGDEDSRPTLIVEGRAVFGSVRVVN